jgi:monoamine oxidase
MESVNVAVVGGGVSGVYAAWRLQTDPTYGAKGVMLLEGSDRIGGRLESLTPPGAPQLRAEFGGMGFTSNHVHVWGLVKTVFELEMTPFPNQTPDLLYLRGQHLTIDNVNAGTIPYVLGVGEKGQQAADLVTATVHNLIGEDPTTLTHEQWLALFAARTFDGLPAQQLGFWNFLTQPGGMSSEAYAFVRDSLGHDLQISNWNAADALEWFFADFAPGTQVMHLPGGYEALPEALGDAFEAAGGTMVMNTSVTRVSANGADGFTLGLSDGSQLGAQVVILAIPQRALQIITPGSVILPDSDVQELLGSVTPLPVLKLFLSYATGWWTEGGVAPVYGRSVTDIPLRTIYYWGVEGDPVDPGNTNSLLMASYTDALELDFWEGLRNGPLYPDQPNPYSQEYPGSANWGQQQATAAMVNEATRQLATVHPTLSVPAPYSTSFRDWRDDPYGGAMHAWNVGVMSDSVIDAVMQPRAGANLFICGESYSRKQGWAEGAITTAEAVVETLGLAPPSWLPSGAPALA